MDDMLLRRYRLGQLTEMQRQQIEARAFEDDDLDNRIEAAGDDLLDDYARQSLSPSDRAAVERNFPLARIAAAQALAKRIPRVSHTRTWPRWAVAAALAFCLAPAAYYWRGASLRNEPAPIPSRPSATIEFALTVPVRRGPSSPLFRIPSSAGAVHFHIATDPGHRSYEVKVRSAARGPVSTQYSESPAIQVQLPASVLAAGDYDFIVSGIDNQKPTLLATYSCRIQRD